MAISALPARNSNDWFQWAVDIDTISRPASGVWSQAVRTRASLPARWVAIGDSITEGQGGGSRANRWIDKCAVQLRAAYPVAGNMAGTGYVPSYYAHQDSWNTGDIASSTGTINNVDYVGDLGMRTITLSANASRTYNFTGTDLDLYWTDAGGSGTWTYQIDNQAAVSVPVSGNYIPNMRISNVRGLAGGSHTLKITAGSGGTAWFNGFAVFNGDHQRGITVYDSGHFGWQTNNFIADAGTIAANKQTLDTVGPDLVTVMLGTNEFTQGTPVATFQTRLDTIITGILQPLVKQPTVVLIAAYRVADAQAPGRVATWAQYVSAIQTVATNRSLTFLDLSASMPTTDTSGTGFYSTDGVHPNASGHQRIADLTAPVLRALAGV